jgi:hypothetical protein
MKKFLRVLSKILIGLIVFIIVFKLVMIIPIKKAVKIDTVKSEFQELTTKDTRIFCTCEPTATGEKWNLIGKGNVLFNKFPKDIAENACYIALEGNYPKKLNWSLCDSIFVFEGTYIPNKEDTVYKLKTFEVKKWNILYPIKYRDANNNTKTKNSIIVDDIFLGQDMPSH